MSLYWVKYEGFPWWPTQVVASDEDTPEGYAKVQYFVTGEAGYVQLDDPTCVHPFGENDEDKRETSDEQVVAAISEATAVAEQIKQAEEDRRRRKEEKAKRREEKELAAQKEKSKRAEEKAKRAKAKRDHGGRTADMDASQAMRREPDVVKRSVSDEELLSACKRLEAVLALARADDTTAVEVVRPFAEVLPTLEQLYVSGAGRLLSSFVLHHDWPHAAALAAGVLEFWFFRLEQDISGAVIDF
jgi:hypothetical protein